MQETFTYDIVTKEHEPKISIPASYQGRRYWDAFRAIEAKRNAVKAEAVRMHEEHMQDLRLRFRRAKAVKDAKVELQRLRDEK